MVREDTPMYYMIAIINNGEAERGIRIYNTANQSINQYWKERKVI